MALKRIKINNFKSIKHCDMTLENLNTLIGENGAGKTNIIEAINYFYCNLTENNPSEQVFDENNKFSNEINIELYFDLSEFVKIAKNNIDDPSTMFDEEPEHKSKYQGYYKAIISLAPENKNESLCVKLSQIKNNGIKWNLPYKERLVIKSLFPVFYINSRNMDVNEWSYLWDVLGELSKVSNAERKLIENKIKGLLTEEDKETSKKLKGISRIFEAADVNVRRDSSSTYAKNLAQIFFSGETIIQSGKSLNYYSTGTSSIKYIELLLRTIDEITKTKLKEPIVLLDEPEISLHPNFIDELAETIVDISNKVCCIISTHSSRLTKNIIISCVRNKLYRVRLINKYTSVQPMRLFAQYSPVSMYRVTDEHVNSYFSRAILFVEGETELELFSNPFIKLLFPFLKRVDVFKAMTQTPILNIMNPLKNKNQTPYLCLIDLDKVISYNKSRKRFDLRNEYFSDSERECMQFKNKKENLPYVFHQRKRINAMKEKLHIHYFKTYMSSSDEYYSEFIKAIRTYLLNYNCFVLTTTIEGCLINGKTIDYSLEHIRREKKRADVEQFGLHFSTLQKTDKINALRIIFNGKSDLLYSYKNLKNKGFISSEICSVLEKVMIKKTEGWITKFIDLVISDITNLGPNLSVKSFEKYLEDDNNKLHALKQFRLLFPELFSLLQQINAICL